MGEEDTRRQALNVARMRLLGAEVVPVTTGSRTLKDAINEAMRDWVTNVDDTHYLLGTVAGPHPFPVMVRDFQRVIGDEARQQVLDLTGRLPDAVVACVGGGSNAIGHLPRVRRRRRRPAVRLRGRRRRRRDRPARGDASPAARPACCTAPASYLLQDEDGQTDRVALDLAPAWTTRASGRSTPGCTTPAARRTEPVTDAEAMDAFRLLCRTEGIIPAIETAHALAGALRLGPRARPGRGRSWSACPAAATRTSTPRRAGSGSSDG